MTKSSYAMTWHIRSMSQNSHFVQLRGSLRQEAPDTEGLLHHGEQLPALELMAVLL